MSSIISAIGSIVTGTVSWITSTVGVIVDEDNVLLLFFVLSSFLGVGIGLFKRLTR